MVTIVPPARGARRGNTEVITGDAYRKRPGAVAETLDTSESTTLPDDTAVAILVRHWIKPTQ